MTQPWLTIIGLVLDLAGFGLLLREWWLAFFNEGRQLEMAEEMERARQLRTVHHAHAPDAHRRHLETTGRMMDDMAVKRARAAHVAARRARKAAFLLSAVLIVVGSLLQIAGAWPL